MKANILLTVMCAIALFSFSDAIAQRHRSSSYSTVPATSSAKQKSHSAPSKQTYDNGSAKYYYGETYKTTGMPKVDRSSSEKKEFLKAQGYQKPPTGYEVDHIVPLSRGGADRTYNMQLIPKEAHKQKTASERKKN